MQFDYIIIGAGSAGAVLANRLSKNPQNSVLLVEAGRKDKNMNIHIPAAYSKLNNSNVDWAYWSEPQKEFLDRRIFLPRGKTLGGCSSTNAMIYIRGNQLDYDKWAALGNEGWSYEEVLPYFKRSEDNQQFQDKYHGKGGELYVSQVEDKTVLADAFVKAHQELGYVYNEDVNGEIQDGVTIAQFTIKNGKRWSTAQAFLRPILSRPNLTVLTNAQVSKILIENKKTTGIEYLDKKGKKNIIKSNKEVILSAGAFNSPQLLMLSGIGDENELKKQGIAVEHHLPGVGKNLQDHLFFHISCLATQKVSYNNAETIGNLLKYLFTKRGPFSTSPLETCSFVRTEDGLEQPDLQLHFVPAHFGDSSYDPKFDMYDPKTMPKTEGYTILPTLLKPKSRGYVGLKSSNPLDAPVIQPNFCTDEYDRNLLMKAFKFAKKIHQAEAFKPYFKEMHYPLKSDTDEEVWYHIQKTVETVYHPVGTCKMGNDTMAVVDSELKVHGIEGLRVADASIMPEIVSGNTNAPSIMIGEKASDLIKGVKLQRESLEEEVV